MIVVHRGFDGLDVSFRGSIPLELSELLRNAKETAIEERPAQLIAWNGVRMHVQSSGANGYQFRCDTGPLGATWFFKKPNPRDPWGIRVSCKSLPLALRGLGQVRADLHDLLESIDVSITSRDVSIGRADYAIDFLMPEFELEPDCFVMHSNSHRTTYRDMVEHGTSGRVTGVQIGAMPFRQIAVYDKRADIIHKGKSAWWKIYNANLEAMGAPELITSDPASSRIWRVEARAGKKHLKDRWGIRRWCDFDDRFGDVVRRAFDDIHYAVPQLDTNRSRWPNHPLWDRARAEIGFDLHEMISNVDPRVVKEVMRKEHQDLLMAQIVGLTATLAATHGLADDGFRGLPSMVARELRAVINITPDRFREKVAKAAKRLVFLH